MNEKVRAAICFHIRTLTGQGLSANEIAEHINAVLPHSNHGHDWNAGSICKFARRAKITVPNDSAN